MWFQRFFKTISLPPPPTLEALARLNPDKFYLENVRSLLGVSAKEAEKLCDIAVRQGVFAQWVEVLAPDGVVAASGRTEKDLPAVVDYWVERDGDHVEAQAPTATLQKRCFYRLINESIGTATVNA